MASWPSTLPMPQRNDYAIEPATAFLRTDMEGGPARQRLIFTQVPAAIPVTFKMTSAQLATFRAFWGTINLGADWFDGMPLDTDQGVNLHEARFTETYTIKKARAVGKWLVSARLEVRTLI